MKTHRYVEYVTRWPSTGNVIRNVQGPLCSTPRAAHYADPPSCKRCLQMIEVITRRGEAFRGVRP